MKYKQKLKKLIEETKALQQVDELDELICFLERINPKIILEIGVWRGGLASILKHFFPKCRVIGVDINALDDESMLNGDKVYPYLEDNIKKYNFEYIQGNTRDESTLDNVLKSLDGDVPDFVFIDAEHGYDGVKADYEVYGKLGRFIGFHDLFNELGPKKLWNEKLVNDYNSWYMKSKQGLGIGIIKNEI